MKVFNKLTTEINNLSSMTKVILEKNSPTLLTAVGTIGVVTTTVVACKNTPKAVALIDERKEIYKQVDDELKLGVSDYIYVVGKCYAFPIVLGTMSIACFWLANKVNIKKQAALAAAYQISADNLKEYKDKVAKTIGDKKTEEIESKIAKERIANNPPSQNQIIFTGSGDTLCYDSLSGRYFKSSAEKIRQEVNKLNADLINDHFVSLNDFYYAVGLESIALGDKLGWTYAGMNDLIYISFDSELTPDNEPCLVLMYDIEPSDMGVNPYIG